MLQVSKQAILRLIESHTPYIQQLLGLFKPFVDILCLSPQEVVAETEQRAGTGSVADVFRQAVSGFNEVCCRPGPSPAISPLMSIFSCAAFRIGVLLGL